MPVIALLCLRNEKKTTTETLITCSRKRDPLFFTTIKHCIFPKLYRLSLFSLLICRCAILLITPDLDKWWVTREETNNWIQWTNHYITNSLMTESSHKKFVDGTIKWYSTFQYIISECRNLLNIFSWLYVSTVFEIFHLANTWRSDRPRNVLT